MGALLKDRPNEVCDDNLGAAKIMDCIKDTILLSTERERVNTLQSGIDSFSCKTGTVFSHTCDIITVGLRKPPHLCTTKLGHLFYQTMPL